MTANAHYSQGKAQLYIFEDNEAVIKMIIKGRSPTMRHVSRTHRVGLDWSFDRVDLDPKIRIKYVNTKNKLADISTKGSFNCGKWNHNSPYDHRKERWQNRWHVKNHVSSFVKAFIE